MSYSEGINPHIEVDREPVNGYLEDMGRLIYLPWAIYDFLRAIITNNSEKEVDSVKQKN